MRSLTFLSLLAVSCTYGGSDADPLDGYDPAPSMSTADASSSTSSAPSSPSTPSTGNSGASDAGKPVAVVDAGAPSSNACMPAQAVATCDPIRNSGCPPLMQCDIEPSATTPTGRCVFYMDPLGGPCSSSFVSNGCAAQNTCVSGMCRKMCYCDSDCPQGQTCSDASGPGPAGAFKLCR